MLGSVGVRFWYVGGMPRFAGRAVARIVRESVQENPPNAVLMKRFFTFVALAEAVSIIQSSTPAGVILPAAIYFPSGDHCGWMICAPLGRPTAISLPSEIFLSLIPTK